MKTNMKKFFTVLRYEHFCFLQETQAIQHIIQYCIALVSHYFAPNTYIAIQPKTQQYKYKTKIWQKIGIGMTAGVIFWTPFWSFVLHEIAPLWIYISITFLVIIGFCIFLLSCLSQNMTDITNSQQEIRQRMTTKSHDNVSKHSYCAIPNNKRYRHILRGIFSLNPHYFFVQFWLFLWLCILILSILHHNIYIAISLFYPLSITLFLFLPREYRFWFGFFVGIMGFYWMTLSFRFEDLHIIIPFAIIGVGITYGILLWFLLFFNNLILRILAMCSLFVIHPTGFNWFNVAYLSSYSIFDASLLSLVCIAFGICLSVIRSPYRYISIFCILLSFDYSFTIQEPKLHAKIIQTEYDQDMRWRADYKNFITTENLNAIQEAIAEHYPIIIFPETSLPFIVNTDTEIYRILLEMSKDIIIFIGGIRVQSDSNITQNNHKKLHISQDFIPIDRIKQDNNTVDNIKPEQTYINTPNTKKGYYNTTFIFANATSIVADKVALVPFGETLPFNNILGKIFENIFGESFGFNQGNEIIKLQYNGLKIANANCYEGTMSMPYESGAQYIIMGSNNAWFSPSTQHFMQQMIIKYYARAFDVFVYHATNLTPKAIISPNNGRQ